MDNLLQNSDFIGSVMIVVAATQAVLWGFAKALERFKDKTATGADNKAYAAIRAVLTFIDMITGNREHQDHKTGGGNV
jgi:flagellar basal body-associated protein FliL